MFGDEECSRDGASICVSAAAVGRCVKIGDENSSRVSNSVFSPTVGRLVVDRFRLGCGGTGQTCLWLMYGRALLVR